MNLGIAGRTAIVTGGSKGLGRAAALALAREGVSLTLFARSREILIETADEIVMETGARNVATVHGDLTSAADRERLLSACPAPDILVVNPGRRQVADDPSTMSREAWNDWFDAHFFSSLELIRAVTPGMCQRCFGRIASISVSLIKYPKVNFAYTHAAHLALSGAIAAMARELIGFNVTINTVCPGLFDTEALRAHLRAQASRTGIAYDAILRDRLEACPAGRLADPQECGDLVAFLCSAQMGFTTAQNLVSDGGAYQGLF
jgi:3-oxoacyl-[acyl-carrier protein] reductase